MTSIAIRHFTTSIAIRHFMTSIAIRHFVYPWAPQIPDYGVRRYERSKSCLIIKKTLLGTDLNLLLAWGGLQWRGYTYAPQYRGHAFVFVCGPMSSFECERSLYSSSFVTNKTANGKHKISKYLKKYIHIKKKCKAFHFFYFTAASFFRLQVLTSSQVIVFFLI